MKQLFDENEVPTRGEAERGLPELRGSEKQIGWAEKIRRGKLRDIDLRLGERRLVEARLRMRGNVEAADLHQEHLSAEFAALGPIEREDRSWWWIERRDLTAQELLAGKEPPPDPNYPKNRG
jgi:hypothetical protein